MQNTINSEACSYFVMEICTMHAELGKKKNDGPTMIQDVNLMLAPKKHYFNKSKFQVVITRVVVIF
jgi:hypothetical protein